MSKFDMNKLMQQAQQMQTQMAQVQEEAKNEIVEASAGGRAGAVARGMAAHGRPRGCREVDPDLHRAR